MKKIGIVTFHNSLNYGAVLQAYALQEILGKNYDASVVNYKSLVMHNENLNFYNSVKKITKSILKWVIFYHRSYLIKTKENRFKDFINNNLNLSSKYNSKTIFKANNEYDVFVTNSIFLLNKEEWKNKLNIIRYFYVGSYEINSMNYTIVYNWTKINKKFSNYINDLEINFLNL